MSDLVSTFRSYALDKDNCPRMNTEVVYVRVGLLKEAAARIEQLEVEQLQHLGQIKQMSEKLDQLLAEVQTWQGHAKTAIWSDSEECKMQADRIAQLEAEAKTNALALTMATETVNKYSDWLNQKADRIEQLEAALREADKGLKAMIQQYAARDFAQNIVAGDEQYPWVRLAQIGRDAARAALGEERT